LHGFLWNAAEVWEVSVVGRVGPGADLAQSSKTAIAPLVLTEPFRSLRICPFWGTEVSLVLS
jgi:hypothetical protein